MHHPIGLAIIHLLLTAVSVTIVSKVLPGISVRSYGASVKFSFVVAILNAIAWYLLAPLSWTFALVTLGIGVFIIDGFVFLLGSRIVSRRADLRMCDGRACIPRRQRRQLGHAFVPGTLGSSSALRLSPRRPPSDESFAKGRARLLVCAPLLMHAPSASAQGNYRSTPTGGRSALMGDTGVALARDGSARRDRAQKVAIESAMPSRPSLAEDRLGPRVADAMAAFHPDVVQEVREAVERDPVVVVGMAQNPFVKKARQALADAGISFTYLEYGSYVSDWKKRLAIKLWSGWPTFPQVFVRGMLIGGNAEARAGIVDGSLKARLGSASS